MHLLLNKYNKVIYDDNGTFTDYTPQMRVWTADTMGLELVPSEDYLYIGAPHSFASRFFLVDTANTTAANFTVEYYYGSTNWRAVKNLTDETKVGGAPLSQSGFITWDLPTDWVKTQVDGMPELPYNESSGDHKGHYWVRISSSVQMSAGTTLRWLGLIWTTQAYMEVKWPEVATSTYLPTGKTDWYELIEMSTGDVADDLNINHIVDYEMQAKDVDELAKLTALKTMVNILIPMTSSETLRIMKEDFQRDYNRLLGKRLKGIDHNKDEKISDKEADPMVNTRMRRT